MRAFFFDMSIILFDDQRSGLFPLTLTRPCGNLRVGILTIQEKWHKRTNLDVGYLTADYLKEKFPYTPGGQAYYVSGRLLPDQHLIDAVLSLKLGEGLYAKGNLIAFHGKDSYSIDKLEQFEGKEYAGELRQITRPYDIFQWNDAEIRLDFELLSKGRKSASLSASNTIIGHDIFVEEGAKAEAAIINTTTGPVYLAKDSEIMEGSLIRGPFALGEQAVVKMGAKIYGATTIGEHSKVGGEISNVVIQGYSNKGHDGFIGNAVLGEWCNLGADTNSSNLKNNYTEIKVWNYQNKRFDQSGLQFCGLIMGDHSKCGINTMFNTGTVVGVSANIFGSGFPRNFIPSFAWGGATGFSTYAYSKACDTAERVMLRRGIEHSEADKNILKYIFETSAEFRIWEK